MSVTTIPATQDIIDVNRGFLPPTYESYMPYRRIQVKRTFVDSAPGKFTSTLDKNSKRTVDKNTHHIGKSLSDDFGLLMKQNVSQNVQGGGDAQQRVEQVLKTDRSWR